MPRQQNLSKMYQTTIGADGTGRITQGPTVHGTEWLVTSMSVELVGVTDDSEARIYKNGGGALIAGTYSGSMDSAGGSTVRLAAQENIHCVWSNATPGATAQLTLLGSEIIQGA